MDEPDDWSVREKREEQGGLERLCEEIARLRAENATQKKAILSLLAQTTRLQAQLAEKKSIPDSNNGKKTKTKKEKEKDKEKEPEGESWREGLVGTSDFNNGVIRKDVLGGLVWLQKSITLTKDRATNVRLSARAYTLSQLDHPGIVRYGEPYETDKAITIPIYDRVVGQTLQKILEDNPQSLSTEAHCWSMLYHLADALFYLHVRGLWHGNVTPAHILITRGNRPLLVDFTVYEINKARFQRSRAPELQASGKSGSYEADVYSLGETISALRCVEQTSDLRELLRLMAAKDPQERATAPYVMSCAYHHLPRPRPVLFGESFLSEVGWQETRQQESSSTP